MNNDTDKATSQLNLKSIFRNRQTSKMDLSFGNSQEL